MTLTRFEKLTAWQKARELAPAVYRETSSGELARDYAFRDRIRRAAISVMSNIAEGFERYGRTEFRHFVSIARGSVSEVRSQRHLAHDLRYIDTDRFDPLYELALEISRLLASLHRSLSNPTP